MVEEPGQKLEEEVDLGVKELGPYIEEEEETLWQRS